MRDSPPNAHPKAPLLRDERGYRIKLQAMRRRFGKAREAAGQDWQIRDLQAKAAATLDTTEDAQALLAQATSARPESTVD